MIISVQSFVSYGHVGNSAAIWPLHDLGFELCVIPTTLLSNHLGYGDVEGRILDASEVRALAAGITRRGAFTSAQAMLTGFLGDPDTVDVVLDMVAACRESAPHAPFICDPVMGDHGRLYVTPKLAERICAQLAPRADVLVPNAFELGLLTQRTIETQGDAVAAAQHLHTTSGATVIATSVPAEDAARLAMIGVHKGGVWSVSSPRIEGHFVGTGDVFSALVTALWLRGDRFEAMLGHATSAMVEILQRTARRSSGGELMLTGSAPAIDVLRSDVWVQRVT